jgi:uncharacterized protein YggT (Ycf19 family)
MFLKICITQSGVLVRAGSAKYSGASQLLTVLTVATTICSKIQVILPTNILHTNIQSKACYFKTFLANLTPKIIIMLRRLNPPFSSLDGEQGNHGIWTPNYPNV